MTTDQPAIIAGFGFDTDSAAPDLSDLDEVLARIAATGASHAELSLCNKELIAGGRILPQLAFRPGTVMIVELPPHHLAELEHCAETARRFVDIVNQAQRQAA